MLNKIGEMINRLFGEPNNTRGFSPNDSSQMKKIFSGHSFADILPYEAYDEENGLFIGKNSLGFVIETSPLLGADHSIQAEVSSIFEDILQEGDSIQCLLWADHRVGLILDKWEGARKEAKEIIKEIAKKRAEYFKNSAQLSSRMFRFILSYSVPKTNDPSLISSLITKKERILKTLSSFVYAYSWSANQFLESVGALVNFTSQREVKKERWNWCETLSNQLVNGGSIQWNEDGLEWKNDTNMSFKSFRATKTPDHWSLNQMQCLIGDLLRDAYRMKYPFYLHYGVHCPNQSKEENNFWKRSQFVEKQGQSLVLLRTIPDLGSELKECESVRAGLLGGSKFVLTQLSAGVWAAPQEIVCAEQSIKSLFRINQFTVVENHYLHLPQFLASLPMTWAEYVSDLKSLGGLLKTTLACECVNLVPMQGEWQGTVNSPGMLMLGRRGQVINWNPFDNKGGNYNIVVIGRSGSGKSVFMQDLLLSGLGTGAKVFILEVGRSFEKMCDLVGGQHIEFSKESPSPICLNPFTHISKEDEDARNESFSALKSIISCMVDPAGTTRHQDGLIEMAIRQAWDKKYNQATITDVVDSLYACQDGVANTIAVMLMSYTKQGVYAKYFEGENNINFTNPMVLIELEELKDKKDLQAVVLQLCIMTITNKALLGDRKTPFYICIDEAWDLLRAKQSSSFIETLARRLRKYYGSLVIGTQGFEEFFNSPGAQAAFDNSDWMCLLKQKDTSISKLNFSEHKKKMLESLSSPHEDFREVMICDADGGYPIARIVLDPFSKLLYSTKPEEYSRLKELTQLGMSTSAAINHMVGEYAAR
ncbi:type IV secretion system protein TraC [Candidatus Protochlamydia naegleriophila]|nr:type IV secretion system protein TraC [Candidatus Protochlamydia naegleriophila]